MLDEQPSVQVARLATQLSSINLYKDSNKLRPVREEFIVAWTQYTNICITQSLEMTICPEKGSRQDGEEVKGSLSSAGSKNLIQAQSHPGDCGPRQSWVQGPSSNQI